MSVKEVTSLKLVSQEPAPAPKQIDPAHLHKIMLLAQEINADVVIKPSHDLSASNDLLVYVPSDVEDEPATFYHIKQNKAQE